MKLSLETFLQPIEFDNKIWSWIFSLFSFNSYFNGTLLTQIHVATSTFHLLPLSVMMPWKDASILMNNALLNGKASLWTPHRWFFFFKSDHLTDFGYLITSCPILATLDLTLLHFAVFYKRVTMTDRLTNYSVLYYQNILLPPPRW